MNTSCPQHRRSAFTLIETIAAVLIVAIAIPPLLWSVRDAHVQRIDTVLASRARWLAVEKLEDVIADRHSSTRGWTYIDETNYPDESPVATDTTFDRTVTIAETEADLATPGTGYRTVTVAVSWTDGSGAARSLHIATVLTDYNP